MIDNINNAVRIKHPKMGFKADYEGSRSAAIELFCESCMGGSRSLAQKCESFTCHLWRYRPGSTKATPKGIPSQEEYKEAIDYMEKNDGRVLQGRKLGLSKHKIEEEE